MSCVHYGDQRTARPATSRFSAASASLQRINAGGILVLAVLSLRAGEIVGTDRLADIGWGDSPPSTPMNTLQSHVSHLRGVLGSKAAILARPPGYVLDAADEGTDVLSPGFPGLSTRRNSLTCCGNS